MAHIEFFPSTSELFRAEVSSIVDRLYDMAMSEVSDLLDDWHSRYPRHKFRIGSYDGLFHVEISPPLHGLPSCHRLDPVWACIDYIPHQCRRGVVGQLAAEIEAASSAWCAIQAQVGIPHFGWIDQEFVDEPR